MAKKLIKSTVASLFVCMLIPCAYAEDANDNMTMNQFKQWLQGDVDAKNRAILSENPKALKNYNSNTQAAVPATPYTASNPGPPTTTVVTTQPVMTNNPNNAVPANNASTATNNVHGAQPYGFLEAQQTMIDSVPVGPFPPTRESTAAFNSMLKQNMPLSPQQVVRLRQQIDLSQRAAAVPANIPPKPVSSTVMINLAPGTTPPAIRLAQGYVTSLVFVDSTGSPWPIAAFDIGSPKAVNVQWDGKSNIIFIQAVSPYSDGNMVVRLAGLPTPVTLEIVSGQRVVDFRADIHVPGIGPNTKEIPVSGNIPDGANQLLLGILDGVAPAGGRSLTVRGADCQAWMLGEKIYLRTRLTVLSPGWTGSMTSPDGMLAYELPKTSSILVSRYGEPTELKVEGF